MTLVRFINVDKKIIPRQKAIKCHKRFLMSDKMLKTELKK